MSKVFTKLINNKYYKLFCGDYKNTILQKADLIFTSPPYNIGSNSPKKITNRKYGGYDSKSWGSIENYTDNLSKKDYQNQQSKFLIWCSEHININGNIVYNHKLRHKNKSLIFPNTWFPSNTILNCYDYVVWDRKSTHNHCKQYLYQHDERLYVFCLPNKNPFFKNDGQNSIWRINPDRKNKHNAPFPLELARKVIKLWCPPNGTVCDPYSGSGTTMIAALLENRNFIGSEILQPYFSLSIERFLNAK